MNATNQTEAAALRERVELDGVPLLVEFDYSPGEKRSWDSPGEPECLDILSVTVPGSDVDLIPLLSNQQIDHIEAALKAGEEA